MARRRGRGCLPGPSDPPGLRHGERRPKSRRCGSRCGFDVGTWRNCLERCRIRPGELAHLDANATRRGGSREPPLTARGTPDRRFGRRSDLACPA